MTNEGTEQEYEVLIRCTHNDKKFAARVCLYFISTLFFLLISIKPIRESFHAILGIV